MGKTDKQGANAVHLALALLLGGLLALGVEIIVLLLGAMAVSKGILSDDAAAQVTVVACVLGCLIGGMFACRRWTAKRLVAGVGAGAVCFLLILAGGLLMGDGLDLGSQGMLELAACLCGGAVAGLLSRKKKKGKRTARKPR